MAKVSRTLQVLVEIRNEMRDVKVELRATKLELGAKIDALTSRMDNFVLWPHRGDHVELRQRVERLESHVGLPHTMG